MDFHDPAVVRAAKRYCNAWATMRRVPSELVREAARVLSLAERQAVAEGIDMEELAALRRAVSYVR